MRGIRFIRAPSVGTVGWWLSGGISASDVAGVWQSKAVASLAASYLRLAGDQGNANIDPAVVGSGVAPTWDAVNGWKFNGSTQWLNSGILAPNNVTWSMIIKFSGATIANQVLCGAYRDAGGTTKFLLQPSNGTNAVYYNGTTGAPRGPWIATGTLCIAGNQPYRNGVAEATFAATAGAGGQEMYIGALNYNGSAVSFTPAYITSVAIYKATIAAAQVLAVHAAMP